MNEIVREELAGKRGGGGDENIKGGNRSEGMTRSVVFVTKLFFLLLLGAGGNLILFCLLKAFAATDVSALQPFRYAELVVSAAFGFVIFNELPTMNTLMGAAIIVPATFYIAYIETHKQLKLKGLKETAAGA